MVGGVRCGGGCAWVLQRVRGWVVEVEREVWWWWWWLAIGVRNEEWILLLGERLDDGNGVDPREREIGCTLIAS